MTLAGRALSYGGVSLPVAALGTHLQGGLPAGATAAVALLGVVMLLGRMHLAGVLPQLGPRARRVGAPAVALLLVGSLALSGVGPTGVESAAAVTSGGTCSYASVLKWFGVGATDQCNPAPETSTAENQVEIYQDAVEAKAWSETITTQTNNSLTNLQTTLYASGQAVQMRAIQNGSSVAQVNQQVNESINERIAKMQRNQIQAWNQYMQSLKNIAESQNQTSVKVLALDMHSDSTTSSGVVPNVLQKIKPKHFSNKTYVLSNGEEVKTLKFEYTFSPDDGESSYALTLSETKRATTGFVTPGKAEVVANITDRQRIVFANRSETKWGKNWQTLKEKAALAKENLAASTPTLVDRYQAGELNVSDAINPTTLAQEYATKYSQTGNLAYARATAAASGYATPSLENVSVMNVTHDGLTYTGALFSQSAPPNGTWVLNQTYDATQIDGAQLVATTGGEMVELDGEFTVSEMRNANGETLNQTSVRSYSYETSNASEYIALQQELNELRQEVANQTASGGGGSGGTGGGSSPVIVAGLGVAALLAVVYLQNRSN